MSYSQADRQPNISACELPTADDSASRRRARRRVFKRARRSVLPLIASAVTATISILPRRVAIRIGSLLGDVCYVLCGPLRRRVASQVEFALESEFDRARRRVIARGVFRHFAQLIFELPVLARWGEARILRDLQVDGRTELEAALTSLLQHGRGVIVLTAHFGNWELVPSCVNPRSREATYIARRYRVVGYQRLVERMRKRLSSCEVLYQDQPLMAAVRRLRENRPVGMLSDVDAKQVPGIFLPFFGRAAYTVETPAKLCLKFDTPILPLYCVRVAAGYRLITGRPIVREDVAGAADPVLEITRAWSAQLEAVIREYPEQWIWMHKRWHTTPEILARRQQQAESLTNA
ncbi:MAG: lysophospholipid acyltransferase family protein [Planctomycetota bacterium]